MDAATAVSVDQAVVILVEVVRDLTGAARVEARLSGRDDATVVGSADGTPDAVYEVVDDAGSLVELRAHGSSPDRLGAVLPDAAALLALVTGRARRPGQERVWVGRLGHDLKTPLTAVLGFAGLLGGGGVAAAGPELVAAASRVTEAGERLLVDLEVDLDRWRRPPA